MLKIFFFSIVIILYQSASYSKKSDTNLFNQKYLSNYFSALISFNNQNNDKSIKYFNLSKTLKKNHDKFLEKYVFSLVENDEIEKAIKEIKLSRNKNAKNFYHAKILLIINEIKNDNLLNAKIILNELKNLSAENTFELIISEIIESYIDLFLTNKINKSLKDFGKLGLITKAFQACYINSDNSLKYFDEIINTDDGDYSRYLYFYFYNLVEKNRFDEVTTTSRSINSLNSNLLTSQSKKWINIGEFEKFSEYFSCSSKEDLISEFFFLISNLYSSQNNFIFSNFYLKLSLYLNTKFYFNYSLLAENYYLQENYELSKKILNKFNKNNEIYEWYKVKRTAQIIDLTEGKNNSLKYVENNFKKINDPSAKILFDLANIYKNFKNYEKSIKYYNLVLSKLDPKSISYADTIYRRGSSYERMGNYKKSDSDLTLSLKLNPDDPYVLNYLAYSWLERNYNLNIAVEMLLKAHNQKKNDPYITDSLGWGYFLIGDYEKAEEYLKVAIEISPDDPVIMDHYGDTLWYLGRKLQANYFWKNSLSVDKDNDLDRNKIKSKLINGL